MNRRNHTAEQRRRVLALAARLSNVAEACRRCGMDRTSFYEWKRRFKREGIGGLENRVPARKAHPQKTSDRTAARIAALALEHPACGCNRIEEIFDREDQRVSSVTIQKILNAHDLGTRQRRWLALENKCAQGKFRPTPEQFAFLEKMNPCWRERGTPTSRPREILVQAAFPLRLRKRSPKRWLHVVIDGYSSYAFGLIAPNRLPVSAVALVENVRSFFKIRRVPIARISTDDSSSFSGGALHPYPVYLARYDIEHEVIPSSQAMNGFIQRFRFTFLNEFIRPIRREKSFRSIEKHQNALDTWLRRYNRRPFQGYPNFGATPASRLRKSVRIGD